MSADKPESPACGHLSVLSYPSTFGHALSRYKGKTEKYLNEALGKVTEQLGQFKNVNKKAMDQFNQFTDQVSRLPPCSQARCPIIWPA